MALPLGHLSHAKLEIATSQGVELMRRITAIGLMAMALLVAGCASDAPRSPGAPGGTSTTMPSGTPTTLPAIAPTGATTQPQLEPAAPTTATVPARQELIDACVSFGTQFGYTQGTTFRFDEARVELRAVRPDWFVHIPAENTNGPLSYICLLGGAAGALTGEVVRQSRPLTEPEIQHMLVTNDEALGYFPEEDRHRE